MSPEYYIGYRDAMAELFTAIRQKESVREVLHSVASDLSNAEKPNPHAIWYLHNTNAT